MVVSVCYCPPFWQVFSILHRSSFSWRNTKRWAFWIHKFITRSRPYPYCWPSIVLLLVLEPCNNDNRRRWSARAWNTSKTRQQVCLNGNVESGENDAIASNGPTVSRFRCIGNRSGRTDNRCWFWENAKTKHIRHLLLEQFRPFCSILGLIYSLTKVSAHVDFLASV